jgi:transmembrane sensor
VLEPTRPIKELLREPVDPARTQVVWRRLRDRRPSRAAPAFALALAGSAAALCLWLVSREHGESPVAADLTQAATALSLRGGGAIPARIVMTDAAGELTLSDGSTIALGAGSELRTLSSTPTELATELARGSASFEVTPGGPRQWSVRAGGVEVRVIGTRFVVERLEREVSVRVERGVVRVTGMTVPDGARELRAGESLRVLDEPAPAPSSAEVAQGSEPSKPAGQAPPTTQLQANAPLAAPSVAEPGVEALLAAADRARASGHAAEAARSLEHVLARHSDDARAPLAALTLGRLYVKLERPNEAVAALERATELGLPAALAEEGAAFLVRAHALAGDVEAARAAAERYQAAFPDGRWSTSVREWIGSR